MNIQTVKANLRQTIAGKEAYLEKVRQSRSLATMAEDHALFATQEFLKTNINELKAILQDLEQCMEIPERLA